MVRRKRDLESQNILTEVELEIMSIIWKCDIITIKNVVSKLAPDRTLAYTSVATVVKILENKGFLKRTEEGHSHLFQPLVSRTEYEARSLDHIVKQVFRGSSDALVKRLFDSKGISKDEWKTIETLLEKLRTKDD